VRAALHVVVPGVLEEETLVTDKLVEQGLESLAAESEGQEVALPASAKY